MLKRLRVVLALLFLIGITFLFVDFRTLNGSWVDFFKEAQLIPALFATSFVTIAVLLVLTLLFGRIYCSVICPLGVLQDIISRIEMIFMKKSKRHSRFKYSKGYPVLKYVVAILFFAAMIVGAYVVGVRVWASLIEPYSAYGRIASSFLGPVYDWGNNIFADIAVSQNSTTFWHVSAQKFGGIVTWIALATVIILIITVGFAGRLWCNTICPAGTLLGIFSRFSLFAPVFDSSKCAKCRRCEKDCKSQCINVAEQKIDYSRCVTCFDCIGDCKFDAMHYTFRVKSKKESKVKKNSSNEPEQVNATRRGFLGGLLALGAGAVAKAQSKLTDGGLAPLKDKKNPEKETPVVPPGALGYKNFYGHCTGCQLCIAACPNGILTASTSLDSFMQPVMKFDVSYCRPECNRCSQVCPTGAIRPITLGQKTDISIGQARVYVDECIAYLGEAVCGICERHCPVQTISMMKVDPEDDSPRPRRRPVVTESRCIGCGACENMCPVYPESAIRVEGRSIHKDIS
ncbi:MAG: 4Fe-4S dicluster domain-containing protein [Muribaculaceae bacterium]|nr:4Fe-4S dicluster domain-containing protein [Muribaculaceae bacterium]